MVIEVAIVTTAVVITVIATITIVTVADGGDQLKAVVLYLWCNNAFNILHT